MTQRDRAPALAWLLGILLVGAATGFTSAGESGGSASRPIDFARQIRPILSEYCFACHGPDDKARKGSLRLDVKDSVFAPAKSGEWAVVPGKPDDSELLFRVSSDDPDLKMPPTSNGKQLTADQVALLKRWIEEGAKWTSHWAFEPPQKVPAPVVKNRWWPRSDLDRFILARLEAEGLAPSPEADRETLIRRVTFDLTGLPPTIAEVDQFLADTTPDAYERVVDRLLASPRYGEHMARYWLDAARYGDTHGLHLDNYREIWPYRDWVIRAFNRNLPYDRFLIEQLAGDLLPSPTLDQLVATGYNRCHISTSEGGSIEEEVYVRNVVDQVDTNGTVLLGLTIGCARCHDHKYDPIRMRDYYQLFAFFNNIDGPALDGNSARWAPIVRTPTLPQQQALAAVDSEIAALKRNLADQTARLLQSLPPTQLAPEDETPRRQDYIWINDATPRGASPQGDEPWQFADAALQPVHSGARSLRIQAKGLKQRFFDNAADPLVIGEGDSLFVYVFLDPLNPPREIMLQWHTMEGWARRAFWGENRIEWGKDQTPERLRIGDLPASGEWVRLEVPCQRLDLKPGVTVNGWAFTQFDGTVYWDSAGIRTWTPQPGRKYATFAAWLRARRADKGAGLANPLKAILALDRSQRTATQLEQLYTEFLISGSSQSAQVLEPIANQIRAAEERKKALEDKIAATLIFRERSGHPRPAFILKRGEYDQKGEPVSRAVPAFLPPLPPGSSLDRLGFARWLVAANHPLTARVAVNRIWQQLFGTGLVKTAEDFGAQGEPSSHPELLDALAVEFREQGWDVKRLVRQLVTSTAYRQSSQITPDRLAWDPANRLLARGPRFRLDAEMLRDQALAASGLLVEIMGGPSVKPPQPTGLWEAVGYVGSNTARFTADSGPQKVYRRSVYTFWKRTAPPPQMATLDAPSREACQVRRERTNTPLQALLLLNEQQYFEAARALAFRTLKESGPTTSERIVHLYRLAAGRHPDPQVARELAATLHDLLDHYRNQPGPARDIAGPDCQDDPCSAAAWILLGNTILNLDCVITRG